MEQRIPRADVVTGGFPCQPFSLAGVSSRNFHGLDHGLQCETQGTLFEDIVQVARASNAKALLLENVKNLNTHRSGGNVRTLDVIRERIEAEGFVIFPAGGYPSAKWAVVDSASVSAQRRKRIYMVCIRRSVVERLDGRPFIFPELKRRPDVPSTLREVINADPMSNVKKFDLYGISPKLWASHRERDLRHEAKENGFKTGLMSDRDIKAPTLVARYYKDGKDCLIPRIKDPGAIELPPRMLTPRECAILQCFPDEFVLPEAKTPAYRQMGNSVTVEVAYQIAQSLCDYLEPTLKGE